MTATFTVQNAVTGLTSPFTWTGTTSFDIGTVSDEEVSVDSGVQALNMSFNNSTENRAFNLAGMSTIVKVSGRKSGSLATRQAWIANMKLIIIYHQNLTASNSTLLYINTLSSDNQIGVAGMRCKIMGFRSRTGETYTTYSLSLVEVKDA